MNPIPISVINHSKALTDTEIAPVVAALQIQVSEHLAPAWKVDAALMFVAAGQQPPASNWRLEIYDQNQINDDSGYHTVGADGIPYGWAFMDLVSKYQEKWSITASHELLEMLVNPYANLAAYVPFDDNVGSFYQLEICDPVSPDENGYEINNIAVSDFVFPAWASPYLAEPAGGPAKQVDYNKRLTGPAPAIVPSTTISVFGWRNVQSAASAAALARAGKDVASLVGGPRSFA
jgi:hypothetical protein